MGRSGPHPGANHCDAPDRKIDFFALSVSLIQKVSLLQVPFLGDPRYAYVVAAASVVACVAHLALNFKETLDADKRKPMVWKDANPFGFLSFLFKSVAMFRLMLISAMQTCIDSRNVFEVKPIASARLGLCRSHLTALLRRT